MNASTSATTGRSLRPEWRPAEAVRALATAAARRIHGALDHWAERHHIRRTIVELQALSDDTLKDIGLDRSQIEFVALQCGSSRRPAPLEQHESNMRPMGRR